LLKVVLSNHNVHLIPIKYIAITVLCLLAPVLGTQIHSTLLSCRWGSLARYWSATRGWRLCSFTS